MVSNRSENTIRLKKTILDNAAEIVRLHSRIHETFKLRSQSAEKRDEWKQAFVELHNRYNMLAFPGGYDDALDRIISGDPEAMEAALCFLECRPYFFRSGHMFKSILRKCKKAPLSKVHTSRLNRVIEKLAEWRQRKSLEEP